MPTDGLRLEEVTRTAERFAARHIGPAAAELDHGDPAFPDAAFAQGIEAGFDRAALPEDAGGIGFAPVEFTTLLTALARTCAGHAAMFGVHAAVLGAIHEAGGNRRATILEQVLASGRPVGVAMPEPLPPDDFDTGVSIDVKRVATGPAGLAFNVAPDGFVAAFAKDQHGEPLAFLARPGEGVALGELELTLGLHAMPMATLSVDGYSLPAARTVAAGEQATAFYRRLLAALSVAVGATAVGVMQAARRKALEYAAQRYQGGQMIVDHTHLRQILGAMATAEAAADGAVSRAAMRPADFAAALAAKAAATEAAVRLCTDAVQVLGGYGYMRDYGLEKRMRDAATLALLPISNPRAELLIAALDRQSFA
jgi:alkylation response protein AidB-like acyl-CoA dehydrogenase